MDLHPKVAAAGVGAWVSVIALWALGYVLTIPAEVAAAATGLITVVCAWTAPWFQSFRPGPGKPFEQVPPSG